MVQGFNVVFSLLRLGLAEKYDYLLQYLTRIAGGEQIGFNNSVFLSERQTADRESILPRMRAVFCTFDIRIRINLPDPDPNQFAGSELLWRIPIQINNSDPDRTLN